MKNSITLITLLLLLFAVGCNKEEINPTVNQYTTIQSNTMALQLTATQIENFALSHNQIIEDSYLNFNYNSSNPEQDLYNRFINQPIGGLSLTDKQFYSTKVRLGTKANLDSITNDSIITSYYNSVNTLVENATSYMTLSRQINALKININNDTRVSNKNLPLLYCEVALKSSYLWMPSSMGGNGIGEGIMVGARTKFDWWEIALIDARWFCYGTVIGGPIIGLCIGSAASAFAHWWDENIN